MKISKGSALKSKIEGAQQKLKIIMRGLFVEKIAKLCVVPYVFFN